jgi:hypothetical protein
MPMAVREKIEKLAPPGTSEAPIGKLRPVVGTEIGSLFKAGRALDICNSLPGCSGGWRKKRHRRTWRSESDYLLAASRREVFQQFLRSLIELFLVLLRLLAGFNSMLRTTYPDELLHGRVIHADDEGSDVIG